MPTDLLDEKSSIGGTDSNEFIHEICDILQTNEILPDVNVQEFPDTSATTLYGGARFHEFKALVKERHKRELGIWVNFGYPVDVLTNNMIPYRIAPNTDIMLYGIVVKDMRKNQLIENPLTVNYSDVNYRDVLLMGTYKYEDFYLNEQIFSYFYKQIEQLPLNLLFKNTEKINSLVEYDPSFGLLPEKDINNVIMNIYDYFITTVDNKYSHLTNYNIYLESLAIIRDLYGVSSENKSNKLEENKSVGTTKSTKKLIKAEIGVNKQQTKSQTIISVFENLLNFRANDEFSGNIESDLIILQGYMPYLIAKNMGIDVQEVKQFIENTTNKNKHARAQAKLNRSILEKQIETYDYLYFIETRLGTEKYEKIIKQVKANNLLGKQILTLLSSGERNQIEILYEKQKTYKYDILHNKCGHVELYYEFRNEKNKQIMHNLYQKLMTNYADKSFDINKLFKNISNKKSGISDNLKFIDCRICKFHLICPHLVFLNENINKSYNEIKAGLSQFLEEKPLQDFYYCKICGDAIQAIDIYDEDLTPDYRLNYTEDLLKLLRSEIMHVLDLFTTKIIINPFKLTDNIIDAIGEPIGEFEHQILRSKTNTKDEIKAKLRLYIMIYSFVYLCRLMVDKNSEQLDLSFKSVGTKGISNSTKRFSKLPEALNYAAQLILSRSNVYMNTVKGLTVGLNANFIKETMIQANNYLSSSRFAVEISDTRTDLILNLTIDPVVRYLTLYNNLERYSGRASIDAYIVNAESILRTLNVANIKELEKLIKESKKRDGSNIGSIFAKTKFPHFFNFTEKDIHLDKNGFMTLKTYEDYYDASVSLFYKKIAENIVGDYFYSFRGELIKNKYANINEKANEKANEKTNENPNKTKSQDIAEIETLSIMPEFKKYFETAHNILKGEIMFLRAKVLECAKPYYGYLPTKYDKTFQYYLQHEAKVPLCMIFDKTGKKHNWNILILQLVENSSKSEKSENKKEKSMEKENLANTFERKMTGNKDNLTGKFTIVDTKCSVCSDTMSNLHKHPIPDTEINNAIIQRETISSFFQFYEKRCPMGSIHLMKSDGICEKCGFNAKWTESAEKSTEKSTDNGEGEKKNAYYKKYLNEYYSDLKKSSKIDLNLNLAKLPDYKDLTQKYKKWIYDPVPLLELANLTKSNLNLLTNLCAIEGKDLNDVIMGKVATNPPHMKFNTRAFMLQTAINNLITEYNKIRFYSGSGSITVGNKDQIAKLFVESKTPIHKLAILNKELPEIYDDFHNEFNWFLKYAENGEIIVQFCLWSLATKCLRIWKIRKGEDNTLMGLRQEFVRKFILDLLRQDELKTKAVKINWKEIHEIKKGKKDIDSNYANVVVADTPDDDAPPPNMEIESEGENAPDAIDNNVLSTDAFDMEDDPEDEDGGLDSQEIARIDE